MALIGSCLVQDSLNSQDHKQQNKIMVVDQNGNNYTFPWAGGLNSCQFGSTDLDLDGIKDLIIFDRIGDRLLTFLNDGVSGNPGYTLDLQYAGAFPELRDWMILVDYDMDGREDIFTYSPGFASLKVYRNVSEDHLEFRLIVYPYLTSFQGGGYVNILVTYADYPGIVDLDGDGDLDILTFWGLGSFVEFHRNMSVEKYGHSDSLDYVKVSFCWGYFAESEESNVITLDTCIGWECGGRSKNLSERAAEGERHTGSTFLMLDLNNDQVLDLALGDVDYPTLIELINGGTQDSAYMISQSPVFPANTKTVRLFSMPLAVYQDVDNDGISDLLVSPFDPNPFVTENLKSIWWYRNEGSQNQPAFKFQTSGFIQDQMIDLGSGAAPVLWDYDGDGLMDLIVGNYGYYDSSWYDEWMTLYSAYTGKIAVFKNTGTSGEPEFEFIERDLAATSELALRGIHPAFGDLDGDGDDDMLTGNQEGTIHYYENTAGHGNPADFILKQLNYLSIDVGFYSTPQLIDLDRDGLIDLVIGERGGNLSYYQNQGTSGAPDLRFVTDSLGKVNVTDPSVSLDGFSVPCFFEETSAQYGLIVGSEQGKIFYFTGIDGNLNGSFTESDSLFLHIDNVPVDPDRGYRTAAAVMDMNQDGRLDLIAGNFSGGLEYFNGSIVPPVNQSIGEGNRQETISLYPLPVREKLHIDLTSFRTGKNIQIEFYNILGEKVLTHQTTGGIIALINMSGLKNGLYVYRILILENNKQPYKIQSGKIIRI